MADPVDDYPSKERAMRLPLDPADVQRSDGARLCKFRRRALYVFAVCVAMSLVAFREHPLTFVQSIEEVLHKSVHIAQDPRLEPYQTPESAEHCAEWVPSTDGVLVAERHLATASFELPTAADLLFFLSRGPVSGHIEIIKAPRYSTGPVEVSVTALYHNPKDLQRTKACRMGPAHEHGVLVWADPRHPHADPKRDVHFNITVALPTTGMQRYKDLTTDLALFSHAIDDFFDIWSPTYFDAIRLKTSNAAIVHGGLVGRSAFIETSNAKVEGFFEGLDLRVKTTNAPILSTAIMVGELAGSESRIQLETSNGAINVLMTLVSDYEDNVLRAVVRTSGASLTIDSPSQMADNASLFLDAATSVGPATVRLYSEYEGTYDLRTSLARAEIADDPDIRDPAGEGRQRTIVKTTTGAHARGSIYWSHDGEPPEGWQRGAIKVTTSTSPVKLLC
ncbi:hypothetical protein B0H17DRAFT_347687 [Mycena rosella]|uniref:Uncharacterized protein n=1 Tax=Mycena rosella TaxID=1033263 RepID=A0AAD7DR27_MYCRO|nr:hypothetical protein B0H17DRAFT_347687 [Mycena rosella]